MLTFLETLYLFSFVIILILYLVKRIYPESEEGLHDQDEDDKTPSDSLISPRNTPVAKTIGKIQDVEMGMTPVPAA